MQREDLLLFVQDLTSDLFIPILRVDQILCFMLDLKIVFLSKPIKLFIKAILDNLSFFPDQVGNADLFFLSDQMFLDLSLVQLILHVVKLLILVLTFIHNMITLVLNKSVVCFIRTPWLVSLR